MNPFLENLAYFGEISFFVSIFRFFVIVFILTDRLFKELSQSALSFQIKTFLYFA